MRGESGAVKKQHAGRLTVALVYPNTYPVGMSNLGFLTVYRLLNGFDHVVCERAFLPAGKDDPSVGIYTVESGKPIGNFDIVAFSLSFENDYPAILTVLEKAGIPLESSDRGTPHPLVVAGGSPAFSIRNRLRLLLIVSCSVKRKSSCPFFWKRTPPKPTDRQPWHASPARSRALMSPHSMRRFTIKTAR